MREQQATNETPRTQPPSVPADGTSGGVRGWVGQQALPRDDHLPALALRKGWVQDASRARAIALVDEVISDTTRGDKTRLTAVRTLIQADSIDVRREAIASRERRNQLHEHVLLLREALTIPEIRSALCRLTQQAIAGAQSALPAPPTPSDDDSAVQPT